MVVLSAVAVATSLFLHSMTLLSGRGIAGSFQRMVLHVWIAEWRDLGGWPEAMLKSYGETKLADAI